MSLVLNMLNIRLQRRQEMRESPISNHSQRFSHQSSLMKFQLITKITLERWQFNCEKRVDVLSRQLESDWSSAPIETWHFQRVLKKCWPTRNWKQRRSSLKMLKQNGQELKKTSQRQRSHWQMNLQTLWPGSSQRISFLLNAWKMARNSSTMHQWPHKMMSSWCLQRSRS